MHFHTLSVCLNADMSLAHLTIDELEARLRVLDRQNEFMAGIINDWDIGTPPSRGRETTRGGTIGSRVRSLPPSPPLFRVMRTQAQALADEDAMNDSSSSDEEEDPFFLPNDGYGYWDSWHQQNAPIEPLMEFGTPVASGRDSHWESWDEDGDSDTETVVNEWEDPAITPI
jgi:hypothetical protein